MQAKQRSAWLEERLRCKPSELEGKLISERVDKGQSALALRLRRSQRGRRAHDDGAICCAVCGTRGVWQIACPKCAGERGRGEAVVRPAPGLDTTSVEAVPTISDEVGGYFWGAQPEAVSGLPAEVHVAGSYSAVADGMAPRTTRVPGAVTFFTTDKAAVRANRVKVLGGLPTAQRLAHRALQPLSDEAAAEAIETGSLSVDMPDASVESATSSLADAATVSLRDGGTSKSAVPPIMDATNPDAWPQVPGDEAEDELRTTLLQLARWVAPPEQPPATQRCCRRGSAVAGASSLHPLTPLPPYPSASSATASPRGSGRRAGPSAARQTWPCTSGTTRRRCSRSTGSTSSARR